MTYGHMYKLNCSRPGVSVQTLRHHPTLARARDHGLPGGARLASQVEAEQEQQEIAEPEQQDVQNEETAHQELIQHHTTFDESRCVLHNGWCWNVYWHRVSVERAQGGVPPREQVRAPRRRGACDDADARERRRGGGTR